MYVSFLMFSGQCIIMNARRMGWVGHIACMGKMRNVYKILVGKLEGRDHLEDLGTDGKIILELIAGKLGRKIWAGFICLRLGTSGLL
jgi:hypothetical protein